METYKFSTLKQKVKERLPGLFTSKTMMCTGENVAPAHLALIELVESGRIRHTRGTHSERCSVLDRERTVCGRVRREWRMGPSEGGIG